MNEPGPDSSAPAISEPRRLEFLRVVTWYIYSLRLLRLYPGRYALLFTGWLLLAESLTVFPYVGFWVKAAFAILTAQGIAWSFHCAAGGRPPQFGAMMKAFSLPAPIQIFLVAQVLVAFALGLAYLGWVEGEATLRYYALRDLSGGTAAQVGSLVVFKLLIDALTLWFGFVGLLAFFGVTHVVTAVTMSARAALLNLPALVAMSVVEVLSDLLQEALPQSLPFALLGLALAIVLIAVMVGATYASFRDIFRPADLSDDVEL